MRTANLVAQSFCREDKQDRGMSTLDDKNARRGRDNRPYRITLTI
jgi:hypothetical protein